MQIQKVIEQLGFTAKEAKVYLATLHLGEAHISDIAEKVKMPRSSVQVIADKLHKAGLMNFYVMRRYKYWTAEKPERLMAFLKKEEEDLERAMPTLSLLRRKAVNKTTVKIFNGLDEIKLIYDDIIATKHPVQAIIPWDEWVGLLGGEYIQDFIERRAKHFLKIDLLVARTENSVKLREKDTKELRHTRFLPSRIKIPTANFMYDGKVATISLNSQGPTGLIIEDPDIAQTMVIFFEEIWNQSA